MKYTVTQGALSSPSLTIPPYAQQVMEFMDDIDWTAPNDLTLIYANGLPKQILCTFNTVNALCASGTSFTLYNPNNGKILTASADT